jgi:hypothetical protein
MAGTFVMRIEELINEVGTGQIVGHVEFNQVYAHIQHVNTRYRHPRGGKAFYLTIALKGGEDAYWSMVSATVLSGSGPTAGMIQAVEALSTNSASLAPIMWGNLRMSPHPWVTHNGTTVFDRPPHMPRLTDAELDALHEAWEDLFPVPWTHVSKIPFGNPFGKRPGA